MRLGTRLDGPRQFVVPYFQRGYSWRRRQWNTLFDDILELYELQTNGSHFLGSMVLLDDMVIDGQQRLVTLSLFLAAIRDAARTADPSFADHVHNRYLINRGADAFYYPNSTPPNHDRAAFTTVII